jgi:transposase
MLIRACADRDVTTLNGKRTQDARSSGEFSKLPDQGGCPCPRSHLIEPIWQQFAALLPERETNHPLGCHRSRIPDRVVLEKLVQVLVFGCAYERIADVTCSATTLRDRRDEWIEPGAMDTLRELALEAHDRFVGLELPDVAVDCCITKAPCGGEKAGRSPVDRGKRGTKRSTAVDAKGIPWAPSPPGKPPRLAAVGRDP